MACARACALTLLLLAASPSAASDPTTDLAGLWEAGRNFGPEARGTLTLTRHPETWEAEIGGFSVRFGARDTALAFALPGERGEFQGEIEAGGRRIRGHWIQPPTVSAGSRYASPLLLEATGENVWRGDVVPLEDEFTFYLVARPRSDGSLGAFLRNPNRNLGFFLDLDRLERSGESVRFVGRYLGNTEREEEVLAEGVVHPQDARLSIYLGSRGGSYDFTRVPDDEASFFYARGPAPAPYRYQPPPARDDGWAVGTLEEVGISVEPIRELIETVIEPPAASMHDLYVHGLLIARHGKLVLEEYFHGFHRDKPHDTRSASKSLTSVLVGAAIQDGAPLAASSPVYATVYGTDLPADLDPRKRRMTIEHLLTMSSGLDCDDGDPASPGNEEVMTQEQTEDLDWARYTLNLPMAREPGTLPFYCSASPHLVGRVLSQATGEPLPAVFQRLIAEPLQIRRYHLNLTPTGEPYMGGGVYWLPRDFMKLGQLLLDGGAWNGRRVVSEEWAARSIAPLVEMRDMGYGYLWWVKDYPYRDRTVRAFYAGGNGGQLVIGIPELDLLVTFYAGNYQDRVQHRLRDELVPRYILPAVDGGG